MRKFQFRLASLLRLVLAQESIEQQALAARRAKRDELLAERERLGVGAVDADDALRETRSRDEAPGVVRHAEQLSDDAAWLVREGQGRLDTAEIEVGKAREALAQKTVERKALERLRERGVVRHDQAERASGWKELDDRASARGGGQR